MCTVHPIHSTATPEFHLAWQLYEEAFPTEERRTLEQQEQLFLNHGYRFLSIVCQGEFAGFFGLWQFPRFTFLEHFAVQPSQRGKGAGTKALTALLEISKQPMILEVEPPFTQEAQRRINFYERLGFHLNDFEYWQPPYEEEKPWVRLQLMSSLRPLTSSEFKSVRNQLYASVYNKGEGIL
ncbi:GNAT family N-acetyltransferase [Sabulibacter ruber]|uniref:GNAT family N-acetyltransferase n=1 Tax=Sabulibacter ruber TaxID=2811901 RepID=UPI001A972963|nr:GNAT family N-acetyltransferase [Sabulibacter ruber]